MRVDADPNEEVNGEGEGYYEKISSHSQFWPGYGWYVGKETHFEIYKCTIFQHNNHIYNNNVDHIKIEINYDIR